MKLAYIFILCIMVLLVSCGDGAATLELINNTDEDYLVAVDHDPSFTLHSYDSWTKSYSNSDLNRRIYWGQGVLTQYTDIELRPNDTVIFGFE
jgi:hypothetical protein